MVLGDVVDKPYKIKHGVIHFQKKDCNINRKISVLKNLSQLRIGTKTGPEDGAKIGEKGKTA